MSKRLILVLALAFVLGIAFTAYAEVQNVKVSGDINVKGVARDNFDLAKTQNQALTGTTNFDDADSDLLSITRVRVDADLTDNVSTTIRLLNERDWNGEATFAGDNQLGTNNRNIGLNTNNTDNDDNDIDLDLAYVTLKEFLYSPLSLMVGRQELHFGNELVVGDPDTNIYSAATSLGEGDLSARKSFDAIRATLDYNPLVVDVVYAKVLEVAPNLNDGIDLGGVNATYALNNKTTLEGYLFSKIRGANSTQVNNLDAGNAISFAGLEHKSDIVNTVGIRAVDKTIGNLTVDAQAAYQFGRYNPRFDGNARFNQQSGNDTIGGSMHKRSAIAAQVKAAYDLKDIALISKYSPVISAGYTYLSGANRDQERDKAYRGWDPMFENQTEGRIMNAIFANTNVHRAMVSGKAKLTEDLTAGLDYTAAWFAKDFPAHTNDSGTLTSRNILSGVFGSGTATSGRVFRVVADKKYIGQEIDAALTYDYTEDVQLGLLGGIFLASSNIRDDNAIQAGTKERKANATEIIGSMKVTF